MFFFFFQAEDGIRDLTVTGVQTCALPISATIANDTLALGGNPAASFNTTAQNDARYLQLAGGTLVGALNGTTASFSGDIQTSGDRKSTRLNSSHSQISYAVFCLKKKRKSTCTIYVNYK